MILSKTFRNIGIVTVISALAGITTLSCTNNRLTNSSAMSDSYLLGTVDGKDVTVGDLSDNEKNGLYKTQKQYYEATENLLAQYYFNQYLENYRVKNKLATIEDAKADFYAKNANVTKEEVDKFLKENATNPQLQQIPADKRVEVVTNYLSQMASSKATQNVIQNAMKDGKIVVKSVTLPETPKFTFQTPGYTYIENAEAPVTIVEFADYQCPYCVMAHNEIQKVLEHYNKKGKTQVQFVYYDFPLSFHDQAVPASVAAYCASKQGQFWPMHNKIFSREPRDGITAETYTTHAKSLNLDLVEFKKCQDDPKSVEVVNAQMAEGMRVGVQGTPSIFINGVRYEKQTSFENLKTEIDALL